MMSAMSVATVKIVATGALTSAIPIAAILGAADVSDACGYYHCSNGPKCTRDYNDLPSHCYCDLLC
jgi:hypothetical protein